jgi:hypothetical protein
MTRITLLHQAAFGPLVFGLAVCGGEVVQGGATGSGGSGATTGSGGTSGASMTTGSGGTTGASMTTGSSTTGSSVSGGSGGGAFASCSAPGTCVLAANTCCGVCGTPMLGDVDPVNEAQVSAHFDAVCPVPTPCPACAQMPNPNLFAYCDLAEGTCKEADLPETAFAACTKDEDCTLRLGLGCCTCIQAGNWVGVAKAQLGELSKVLCKADEVCAECEPTPPPDIVAACVKGFCAPVPADGM